jgi:hypothetical protein
MANDFDQFPLYDELVEQDSYRMSNVWVNAIASFYMNLIGYLTQGGILLPQLTTTERDELDTPNNGQMIYNTTLGTAQYFKAGAWVSF